MTRWIPLEIPILSHKEHQLSVRSSNVYACGKEFMSLHIIQCFSAAIFLNFPSFSAAIQVISSDNDFLGKAGWVSYGAVTHEWMDKRRMEEHWNPFQAKYIFLERLSSLFCHSLFTRFIGRGLCSAEIEYTKCCSYSGGEAFVFRTKGSSKWWLRWCRVNKVPSGCLLVAINFTEF